MWLSLLFPRHSEVKSVTESGNVFMKNLKRHMDQLAGVVPKIMGSTVTGANLWVWVPKLLVYCCT